jgi:6-phosphogluconolactonase/glucosamine-6-phosphate isomerase/deaminase
MGVHERVGVSGELINMIEILTVHKWRCSQVDERSKPTESKNSCFKKVNFSTATAGCHLKKQGG